MSKLLEKFQSTTRIRVDPGLAERWDLDVSYHGDTNIKLQIAQAKRTATTLKKALLQFSKIRPEQELAIRAASSAMATLASELAALLPWAKAYKAFCDAERIRENLEELEALATARWGDDTAAIQFEADLVQELGTPDGRLAFAQWLHARREHTYVPLSGISCCVERLGNGANLRMKLAHMVREERRTTNNEWGTQQGMRLIASFATYERYLAHRKEVASKTVDFLKGLV